MAHRSGTDHLVTDTHNDPGDLENTNDTASALAAGMAMAGPTTLKPGQTHAFLVPRGGSVSVVDLDLDEYRTRPRRKKGTTQVFDADSFVRVLEKHGLPETDVFADVTQFALVGVLNANRGVDEPGGGDEGEWAGWGDHRVELQLHKTPAWKAWEALDRKLLTQVAFAEHVEERLIDFRDPDGATMLEVAQTFQASRRGSFESGHRLSSGDVEVKFREETEAKAGRAGKLTIPERFELALAPFEGGPQFKVEARFRYRINDGALQVGFLMTRPDDILRAAFADEVAAVAERSGRTVINGKPARPLA